MTSIAFLADHPEHLHTLAEWFRAEWEGYYAGRTTEDVAHELAEDLNRHQIPIRLVALVDDALAGCIVLREQALSGHEGYSPGLGGLFVAPAYRGRGVGTDLVRAGMQLAGQLGYATVYAGTNPTSSRILQRLGWQYVITLDHHGELVGIYSWHV